MQDVETYLSHNKNSPKYSKISKILRDNEQLFDWCPEEKILDAGCGPGDVTVNALIPWLPPDFQLVMGVDVSPTMVDHALAAHASNKLTFATWDIEQEVTDVLKNGKFASGFDKVFSFYVLHWLQDLGKGVRNLHSLLKTRGQALLFFPVDRIFQRTYKKVRASETWSRYFQGPIPNEVDFALCSVSENVNCILLVLELRSTIGRELVPREGMIGSPNFVPVRQLQLQVVPWTFIRKHFDELLIYLQYLNKKYDVIILSEVWIGLGEEDRYCMPGYNMLLQHRQEYRAGGVLVYVDSELSYSHSLISLATADIINVILSVPTLNNASYKTVTRKIPPFPKEEDPLAEFETMLIDTGFEIMKSEIRDHIDDFPSVEDVTALVESLDPDIAHVPVDLKASYLRDCLQVMDQMEVLNLERTSIKQKMVRPSKRNRQYKKIYDNGSPSQVSENVNCILLVLELRSTIGRELVPREGMIGSPNFVPVRQLQLQVVPWTFIRKHFDELLIYLQYLNKKYDVIILSEVWIGLGEEDRYCMPGYNMLLQHRQEYRAGGVLVYVDSELSYSHSLISLATADIINVILSVPTLNNASYKTVTRKIPPFPKEEDPLAEFETMLIDTGFEIMKSEIRDHIDDFPSVEDVTALVESLDPDIAHVPVDLKASYLRDCLQVMDQMEVLNLERTSIKQKMVLCVIRKP
ncbi:hypothetical protein J6590_050884 [Homalodisca vitripennis]|nr:hypothetical protein J6590_050884 [Homalodisca vitripennis]